MPYIIKGDGRREALQKGEPALNAGELNYQIFYYVKHKGILEIDKLIIKGFVDQFLGLQPNYQRYNDMTGCLVRCAREINRRLKIPSYILIEVMNSFDDEIASYENKKIISNGDVE